MFKTTYPLRADGGQRKPGTTAEPCSTTVNKVWGFGVGEEVRYQSSSHNPSAEGTDEKGTGLFHLEHKADQTCDPSSPESFFSHEAPGLAGKKGLCLIMSPSTDI